MKIHRYEKLWLGVAIVMVVAFIATVVYGATAAGVTMVGDDGGQVDAEKIANNDFENANFEEPGVRQVGDDQYSVHVVAQQFLFRPGTNEPIRIPANAEVTFYVTTPDVVHGFEVPGTNLNTMVIPGQVAQFTTEFEEPGEYGIVCHEYCGAGHHTMAGTIRVVPQSQYNGTES